MVETKKKYVYITSPTEFLEMFLTFIFNRNIQVSVGVHDKSNCFSKELLEKKQEMGRQENDIRNRIRSWVIIWIKYRIQTFSIAAS